MKGHQEMGIKHFLFCSACFGPLGLFSGRSYDGGREH
jgi:hypothetical protein